MKINKNYFYKIILIGQFFALPFAAVISEMLSITSTPISIINRAIILFLSIIVILFFKEKFLPSSILFKISTCFWIFYLLRIFSYLSIDKYSTMKSSFFYLIWSIGGCFVPFFALSKGAYTINPRMLFKLLSLISLIVFISIYPQLSSLVFSSYSGFTDSYRLQSDVLNPIYIGSFGNLMILPSYWGLLNFNLIFNKNYKRFFKVILFVNIILGLILLFGANSRGPIVGFIFTMVTIEIFQTKFKLYSIFRKLIFYISFLGIILFNLSTNIQIDKIISGLISALTLGDYSSQGRAKLYKIGFDNFLSHPFLGNEIDLPLNIGTHHNIVIASFSSGGIIIGLLMILIIIFALRNAILLIKGKSSFSFIGIIFLPFLIQSFFSGGIYLYVEFWSLIGILSSLEFFIKTNSDYLFQGDKIKF